MAEKSGGKTTPQTSWQCVHCNIKVSGMAAGYVVKECFICGKAQITCINPDCKEPFEKDMEVCEKCKTPQHPSQESPSVKVQILCINPECKALLDNENMEICQKCNAPQQTEQQEKQPPSEAQTTCTNSDCGEPLDSDESDLCSKCRALQSMNAQVVHVCVNPSCTEPLPNKEDKVCSKCKAQQILQNQQSMDAQVMCVNPDCREPLLSKEDKVCYKCKAPQTLCINPVCRTPLFTLDQGMCHECQLSQKSRTQDINASVNRKATEDGLNNKTDGAPKLPSTPMETENSIAATSQEPSSVDPGATAKSDIVKSVEGTKMKAKEENTSQDPMTAATITESEKNGQPPATDSTVSPTDKTVQAQSNASSCKLSMTSYSEESSDSDEFKTPPPSRAQMVTDHPPSDPEGCDKNKDGATNVTVAQINLEQLTPEDTKCHKHNHGQDETEESASSKRGVLEDNEEPKLSPKVVNSIKANESAEVKKQHEKNGTKKTDEHKGSGQQQEDGKRSGAQGKGGAASTQEVYVHTCVCMCYVYKWYQDHAFVSTRLIFGCVRKIL